MSLLDLPPLIHDALGLDVPHEYEGQVPGKDEPREYIGRVSDSLDFTSSSLNRDGAMDLLVS